MNNTRGEKMDGWYTHKICCRTNDAQMCINAFVLSQARPNGGKASQCGLHIMAQFHNIYATFQNPLKLFFSEEWKKNSIQISQKHLNLWLPSWLFLQSYSVVLTVAQSLLAWGTNSVKWGKWNIGVEMCYLRLFSLRIPTFLAAIHSAATNTIALIRLA